MIVMHPPGRRFLCPNPELGPGDVHPGQVWENSTDQPNLVHRWRVDTIDASTGEVVMVRDDTDDRPRFPGGARHRVTVGHLLAYWTFTR